MTLTRTQIHNCTGVQSSILTGIHQLLVADIRQPYSSEDTLPYKGSKWFLFYGRVEVSGQSRAPGPLPRE